MNPKNYIISQRLSYLALGIVAGYFIAQNTKEVALWLIAGLVVAAIVLSEWFKRRK